MDTEILTIYCLCGELLKAYRHLFYTCLRQHSHQPLPFIPRRDLSWLQSKQTLIHRYLDAHLRVTLMLLGEVLKLGLDGVHGGIIGQRMSPCFHPKILKCLYFRA
jgi:hypothetical protein